MKPENPRLAIVTATLAEDAPETQACIRSWGDHAAYQLPYYVVNGTYGVVPAFAEGVGQAFAGGAEAVICLHDDVRIDQPSWDLYVQRVLDSGVEFAGFGGGTSLGSPDLYKTAYDPMQLARGGFVSNMQDAEVHGARSTQPVPCVVFDGFCQIGTRNWFGTAWDILRDLGVVHHFYDGMLGCLAARAKIQPGVMIPVKCHHYGGRTAVANSEYQRWAQATREGGDQGFWADAHRIGYEEFRDILPLTVEKCR